MKLKKLGKNISKVEVANISQHGFWLMINEQEHFLSYEDFPWFKEAKISEITDIEFTHSHVLHWPKLDIDLSIEIINRPEKYPVIF